jgi:hypothetical protein
MLAALSHQDTSNFIGPLVLAERSVQTHHIVDLDNILPGPTGSYIAKREEAIWSFRDTLTIRGDSIASNTLLSGWGHTWLPMTNLIKMWSVIAAFQAQSKASWTAKFSLVNEASEWHRSETLYATTSIEWYHSELRMQITNQWFLENSITLKLPTPNPMKPREHSPFKSKARE